LRISCNQVLIGTPGRANVVLLMSAGARATLIEFVNGVWWPQYAVPKLAERTRRNYRDMFGRWVVGSGAELGRMPISEITAEDIGDWQDWCRQRGAGEQAIATAQKPISSAFRFILAKPKRTGIVLAFNPVTHAGWPRQGRKRSVHTFEPWVVEAVRRAILRRPGAEMSRRRDALFLSLMALTGMRPHEARQVVAGELHAQTIVLDLTKTEVPRTVPLFEPLREEAEAHAKAFGLASNQPLILTSAGRPWSDVDYRNWRSRVYYPAREEVAARIGKGAGVSADALLADKLASARPYDLCRHSFIALLLAAGWTLADVASVAGHSVKTLSRVYAAVLADTRGLPALDPERAIEEARRFRPIANVCS
jgi:integrase